MTDVNTRNDPVVTVDCKTPQPKTNVFCNQLQLLHKMRCMLWMCLRAPRKTLKTTIMKLLTLVLTLLPTQIIASSSKIVTGIDLLSEMTQLQESLTRLQTLLTDKSVGEDEEIMNKAAKLFRRARWLIYSSNHEIRLVDGFQLVLFGL
jgi:hypothetical protein